MSMKLFIFTEGGPGIGLGHFARCSALYDEAQKQGMDVTLVVNKAARELGILVNKNVMYSDWQNSLKNFDIEDSYCIVDSYIANLEVYKRISRESKRALYFDDENRLVYPEGMLLNAQVTKKYQDIESLIGLEYALVREAFVSAKKQVTKEKIGKIMVSLGADLHGIREKIVKALVGYDIVMPSGLSDIEMANLIKECDLGVIPASQTALEFCAVGTPFVCIKTATNQDLTWLIKNNIISEEIFYDDDNMEEKVLAQIKELSPHKVREEKRLLLQSLIPQDSAERIIERLTR